jgi:UDP-N-acetylmuramate: L-alanyl-gamma-D-glutamyl-meso-diaminopimelate ligase
MKHVHFIGICGVAMGGLAMAMKRAGFDVSGSDVGIYPPISTYLKEQGVEYYTGWHPERIGKPDLVVVGNVAGSKNPEWQYVQEKKIQYVSYPELIAKYFVKPNSIVCAGTYGKTTTAALLSWILTCAGMNPSYMFGGLTVNDEFPSAVCHNRDESLWVTRNGDESPCPIGQRLSPPVPGDWSVLEGDEYKTARWDNSPKFSHYSPTHLLLTAIEWDHADVYPTEASYFEAFEKLMKSVPKSGVIVTSERIANCKFQPSSRAQVEGNAKYVKYGQKEDNDYQYFDIKTTKTGTKLKIKHNSEICILKSEILGSYMSNNICAAFAMAHEIGIDVKTIIKAIANFKGIKRRLEKRFEGDVTVIDDIAHSPAKAHSTLQTLQSIYKPPLLYKERGRGEVKIFAVFEPNTGNRQIESIPSYDNQFIGADEVIIPRLTHIKRGLNKPEPMDGAKLSEVISKTHSNVKYIDDDNKLINYLTNKPNSGDVVVFLGSHGFRGMIEELIKKLKIQDTNK